MLKKSLLLISCVLFPGMDAYSHVAHIFANSCEQGLPNTLVIAPGVVSACCKQHSGVVVCAGPLAKTTATRDLCKHCEGSLQSKCALSWRVAGLYSPPLYLSGIPLLLPPSTSVSLTVFKRVSI